MKLDSLGFNLLFSLQFDDRLVYEQILVLIIRVPSWLLEAERKLSATAVARGEDRCVPKYGTRKDRFRDVQPQSESKTEELALQSIKQVLDALAGLLLVERLTGEQYEA